MENVAIMKNPSELSDTQLFVQYAGKDMSRWGRLTGITLVHNSLGTGTIKSISHDAEGMTFIIIFIENEVKTDRKLTELIFENGLVSLDFGDFKLFYSEVRESIEQDYQEYLQKEISRKIEEEEWRMQQEILKRERKARKDAILQQEREEHQYREKFKKLKIKFCAENHKDPSPASPLYVILEKLDDNEKINQGELDWLISKSLDGPLAHYYEKHFVHSKDLWDLVKSASKWRKVNQPQNAINLMEGKSSRENKLQGAILTTRGGALRDVGKLGEAEECARQAIDFQPNSFYPLNLLGALHFQRGNVQDGQKFFDRAEKLGAKPQIVDSVIKSTIQKAKSVNKHMVAEYLLNKDPERYKWAKFYLNKS
jgi:tetratricopeptide (TPR) repeat protein